MSGTAVRIARHAAREASADQVSFVASGVAFQVALAVFPAIALVVWLGSRLPGGRAAPFQTTSVHAIVRDVQGGAAGLAGDLGEAREEGYPARHHHR